ncbi:MAG: hypothetical protein COY66_00235 [Candidatus Kerfeldbacteria bacterium CG_4_10_14_0_8_um_filter_42_10]|uniref:Glycosyltransferase family 4 protein n=1 Tax=Candidatus Kerfeldbacteria bacterium CG_4_10_14_0_8_um_filter_42_10 TaxID=2014248 RepID=A0A2M7RLH4_9BACT|nr:MAG: hypothetical protein COY66_00235 [Candidatus Kerfeldbacteria bacterium CG_4_10_14_0_8_um_filter_42_10]
MRILLINNEYPPIGGGGSTVNKYTAEYFVRLGHEVHLVTSKYQDLPRETKENGIYIHRIPAVRRYKDFCSWWELATFTVSAIWFSSIFIKKIKPDLIQSYFAVPSGLVAWLVTRFQRGIPYFVYLGGSDVPGANPSRFKYLYPFLKPLIKLIFRQSQAVIACSDRLLALAKMVDHKSNIVLIPNGVDTTRFQPALPKSPSDELIILGVGRLIKRKGFQFVIQALPQVLEKSKRKFKFRIVGIGEYKTELEKIINSGGLSQYIEFRGLVDYSNLHEEYQQADIFVMPSLSEGMPCALLEAMACGLPAIVTKVSGNDELVKNGVNGYLYDVDNQGKDCDLRGLSDHLANLLNDDDMRAKMAQASRETTKRYDWKNISLEYLKLYEQ